MRSYKTKKELIFCLHPDLFFGILSSVALLVVGYPSGQRGQTVNLLALPSNVRIVDPPPFYLPGWARGGLMRTFRMVFFIGLVVIAVVALVALFTPLLQKKAALTKERDLLRMDNAEYASRISEYRRKTAQFQNNPDYVEVIARQNGMARPNEVIIDFSEKSKTEAK